MQLEQEKQKKYQTKFAFLEIIIYLCEEQCRCINMTVLEEKREAFIKSFRAAKKHKKDKEIELQKQWAEYQQKASEYSAMPL